jgi:hypothetical protein
MIQPTSRAPTDRRYRYAISCFVAEVSGRHADVRAYVQGRERRRANPAWVSPIPVDPAEELPWGDGRPRPADLRDYLAETRRQLGETWRSLSEKVGVGSFNEHVRNLLVADSMEAWSAGVPCEVGVANKTGVKGKDIRGSMVRVLATNSLSVGRSDGGLKNLAA